MKRSITDPITGKTNYYDADLANKATRLATQEQRKINQINDGWMRKEKMKYALPLHKTLALWYEPTKKVQSETQEHLNTTLRLLQSGATAISPLADGEAEQDIPVVLNQAA